MLLNFTLSAKTDCSAGLFFQCDRGGVTLVHEGLFYFFRHHGFPFSVILYGQEDEAIGGKSIQ